MSETFPSRRKGDAKRPVLVLLPRQATIPTWQIIQLPRAWSEYFNAMAMMFMHVTGYQPRMNLRIWALIDIYA